MKRTLKNLFSFLAVFAVVFSIGTEAMAAKKSKTLKNTIKKDVLARPEGFEPPTLGLENRCSIQLS